MNKRRYMRSGTVMLLCALLLSGCMVTPQPTAAATVSPSAAATAAAQTAAPTASPAPTDTPAPTDSPAPAATPTPSATGSAITGLVLVVPILVDNVKTIKEDVLPDGTYREELLYDGMVSIVDERLASIEFSEKAVTAQIAKLNGVDATDITVKSDDVISKQLSYPAWRITYTTGSNEDTRKNVDIYIQTDEWDFRFHTSTPIDSFDTYSESIAAWIDSIDLSDGK